MGRNVPSYYGKLMGVGGFVANVLLRATNSKTPAFCLSQ